MNKYIRFLEERYERFRDILIRCDANVVCKTASCIEYMVFEEFDIDIPCYLCDENLDEFWEYNMIDDEIKELAIQLREMFEDLRKSEYWNVEAVQHSNNWRELFELSGTILSKLYY